MIVRRICFLVCAGLLPLPVAALAADGKDKPPATETKAPEKKPADKKPPLVANDLAHVDADYWLQGEYYGLVLDAPPYYRYLGLQVAAQGDGKFSAMLYQNGLPGYGWQPPIARFKLAGQRAGDAAELAGEGWKVKLSGTGAEILRDNGEVLGTLPRVERTSPTMGLSPSPGAVQLFTTGTPQRLTKAQLSPDGLLKPGAITEDAVSDFRLHLEFRTPYKPQGLGQDRGNSGLYIQQRYEIQILDSFALEGAFNDCGAVYRQRPADLNMSYPPLVWQSYDIWFQAARFDSEGKKIQNARLTAWHNGVPIHQDVELPSKTGAGKAESPSPLPLLLQDHGNPVLFRNLWIEHTSSSGAEPCCSDDFRLRGGPRRR